MSGVDLLDRLDRSAPLRRAARRKFLLVKELHRRACALDDEAMLETGRLRDLLRAKARELDAAAEKAQRAGCRLAARGEKLLWPA